MFKSVSAFLFLLMLASCPVKQFIHASLNKVSISHGFSYDGAKKTIKSGASAKSAKQCFSFFAKSNDRNQQALHFFVRLFSAILLSSSCWLLSLVFRRDDPLISHKVSLFLRNSVLLL